jgi:polyhydroxyalkanoate synthesis regulator phasin
MNQDELSKAIINIIRKETGALKDLLPSDLLENLEKIIRPDIESLIEKSGYISKSKYEALERLAEELEKRIIDLESKTKE